MQKTLTTKEQALNSLGVFDRKAIVELGRQLEFLQVARGRRLIAVGTYMPTTLVAVTGSVSFTTTSGNQVTVESPCAIDAWATDDRRIALVSALAASDTALLLIDWRYRDRAMSAIPRLGVVSVDTELAVATSPQLATPASEVPPAQPVSSS